MIKQDRATWFSSTGNGTTTASASKAGIPNTVHYVTDICASTGSLTTFAGSVVVMGGTNGNIVIWQAQLVGATPFFQTFSTPLVGVVGGTVTVSVTGTTTSYANISGFSINTT